MNSYLELKRWVTEAWAAPGRMWAIDVRVNSKQPISTIFTTVDEVDGTHFDLWEMVESKMVYRLTMELDLAASYALIALYNTHATGLE